MVKKIDGLISRAIRNRVFPGAVLVVGNGSKVELVKSFGTTMYTDFGSRPITPDNIFDIASITKVFTSTLALILIEKGYFSLDTKVAQGIVEFKDFTKKDITIWNLLTHTSGLRISLSSFKTYPSAELRARVLKQGVYTKPGTQVYYSNINSMILADFISEVTGRKFIDLLSELVLKPLKLTDTSFLPKKKSLDSIVPTEFDGWRNRLIHGEVHDESAHALGGIAGHAGLFSTALDLWRFASPWLNQSRSLLSPQMVQRAASRQIKCETGWVGLGWKLDCSNFMDGAPKGTFGHTGFTGTSLVICPKKEKILILLTNRIYPTRGPVDPINSVRQELARIVLVK